MKLVMEEPVYPQLVLLRFTACSYDAHLPHPSQQDETSWILLPVWCGHMIWHTRGSERERDPQRRRQEAGSSHSGRVLSLWQRTERAMLVSAGSQTPRQALLLRPPPLHWDLSFNGLTSPSPPFTALPRTSHSLILMIPADVICVIVCCFD